MKVHFYHRYAASIEDIGASDLSGTECYHHLPIQRQRMLFILLKNPVSLMICKHTISTVVPAGNISVFDEEGEG